MRTIVYVDGFNLYFGLRQHGNRRYYWLDVRRMAEHIVRPPDFELVETKYFTARVAGARPEDTPEKGAEREASRLRQQVYLEALDTLAALRVYEGHFLLKRDYCRCCGKQFHRSEEKMTDVQIATEMMEDAFLGRFDSAVVVSGDGDLVPPIRTILRHFPQKRILVAFPPHRRSLSLTTAASDWIDIWPRTFDKSQLPEELKNRSGITLNRPAEWR